MRMSRSYQTAFFLAIFIHLSVVFMLWFERHHERPVLTNSAINEASSAPMKMAEQQAQAIKAVTVDSQQVMQEVSRLKQERAKQKEAEIQRQQQLNKQAEMARRQRIAEQKHLQNLKTEAAQLAIAHQKKLVEEQARLNDMKQQQEALRKQQELETQKLAEIQKKKVEELARVEQAKAAQVKAEMAKKQREAAQQQAALNAENNARVAGEVDKYKALIINAISQQWILPENANSSLSSQFRIRLAPNGSVLEVNLTRSSGDPILDRSAQAAIYKASPLPVPSDPTAFNLFRDISLTVRPVNARG